MKVELEIPMPAGLPSFVKRGIYLLLTLGVIGVLILGLMEASFYTMPYGDDPYVPIMLRSEGPLRSFVAALIFIADLLLIVLVVALGRKVFTA